MSILIMQHVKKERSTENLLGVNELTGIKESDTGLAPPALWDLAADKQALQVQNPLANRETRVRNRFRLTSTKLGFCESHRVFYSKLHFFKYILKSVDCVGRTTSASCSSH